MVFTRKIAEAVMATWQKAKNETFTYTAKDIRARAEDQELEDEVTITFTANGDSEWDCDEEGCPSPHFGGTAHTRSEYSLFRHVVAYHAGGQKGVP